MNICIFASPPPPSKENKICANYTKYKVPESVKYNKGADSYNFKSKYNTFCSFIFNMTSGQKNYLFSYILLIITMLLGQRIKFRKIKHIQPVISVFLFLIAAILMFNGLFSYQPYDDEYASIDYSNQPFGDPGNPPFFYILLNLWFRIFSVSIYTVKIFPLILGLLSLFALYWFLKKEYNIKWANLGLFVAAFNLPLIDFSGCLRCYILQILLSPLLIYSFFKILDKNKTKYYVTYCILAIFAANTHFYEILFIISNFVFCTIYFVIKKRYKDILKFGIVNFIAALSFLPYFANTALGGALLNNSFNTWIPKTDFYMIRACFLYLFGSAFSLLISACLLFKNFKNRTAIYCIYTIVFVFTAVIILSNLIRPMLFPRYIALLFPIFFIFIVSTKPKPILFLIWFLLIQSGASSLFYRNGGQMHMPVDLTYQYMKETGNKAIVLFGYMADRKSFFEILPDKYRETLRYGEISELDAEYADEILKNNDIDAIFTSRVNHNKEYPKNFHCFFIPNLNHCVYKITRE